jgi:hypothetical protein
MTEQDRKFLKQHCETKRIKVAQKGGETDVARRIVKVKRRTPGAGGFGGTGQ